MSTNRTNRPFPLQHGKINFFSATLCLTAVIAVSVCTAPVPAVSSVKMATASKPTQITQCTGCHAPDLKGRPQGAPNIHVQGGALHDYTKKQFEVLMAAGTMNNGGALSGMPTFKYNAAISDKIFAYIKSLK